MAAPNKSPSQKTSEGNNNSEKLATPVQSDTLSTKTLENAKQAIELASAIPQGLIEKPTQGSSADLNIKDGAEASKKAVTEIQKKNPTVKLKESFIDSLKEQSTRNKASLLTTGVQAQWQSHREVKKYFSEASFADLGGCIWH